MITLVSLVSALLVSMNSGASTGSPFRIPPGAVVEKTADPGVERVSWGVERVEDGGRQRIYVSYPRLTQAFGRGFDEISRRIEADIVETFDLSPEWTPIDVPAGDDEDVESVLDDPSVHVSWYESSVAFRRGSLVSVQWQDRTEGGVHPDAFFGGLLFLVEPKAVRMLSAADAFTATNAASRVVDLLEQQVPEEMKDYCLDEGDLASAVFGLDGIHLTLPRGCAFLPLVLSYEQARPLIDPRIAAHLSSGRAN
ncbi:MAG TPA: hypothetical protein VGF40_06055 [Thermoanaerobaculia bacterium]